MLCLNPATEVKLQTQAMKKCDKRYTKLCISALLLCTFKKKTPDIGNKLLHKSCEVEHIQMLWCVPILEPTSDASLSLQENFSDQRSVYKYLYVTETSLWISMRWLAFNRK